MEELLSMGFHAKAAERALRLNGGNVERSIEFLLNDTSPQSESPSPAMGTTSMATGTTIPEGGSGVNATDEVVVNDISQFSFDSMGSSSCTPIALQFAAIFLRALARAGQGTVLNTYELMTEATLEGISSYSAIAGDSITAHSSVHLSVEEYLAQAPQLDALLRKTGGPYQGLLTDSGAFRAMFTQALGESVSSSSSTDSYVAIVVTKPPETVVVFLPMNTGSSNGANSRPFYLFDSHSRPQLGIDGSYVVKCHSEASLLSRLKALFPALDGEGEDSYMLWMYNSFEGVAFSLPEVSVSQATSSSSARNPTSIIASGSDVPVSTSASSAGPLTSLPLQSQAPSANDTIVQASTDGDVVDTNDEGYVLV